LLLQVDAKVKVKDAEMERVITYIDGFNCYFGLKESGWKCYYWLDYPKLSQRLVSSLKAEAGLVTTKYFTSRISYPEDKRKRQSNFLEALDARGEIEIFYGNYRDSQFECSGCRRPNFVPNEKQTDVNIAVQMMVDAYQDNFDTALLVGGDSDLVPPIKAIRKLFPKKRVMAVFPPRRVSKQIKTACNGYFHIGEIDLKNNLLPDEILKPDGFTIRRPESWK
jgi:uncharacterized LabA/DUF88 family protein